MYHKSNKTFATELKKFIPRPEMIDLFKITLSEAWCDQTNHLQDDSKQLQVQVKELEEKLSYIRELLSFLLSNVSR
jgi:site-specific DNA recombinase